MGQPTTVTFMFKSATMRLMMASCWASFCPKKARCGCTMLKSFVTTVHTPRKCPGREAPHSESVSVSMTTKVLWAGAYMSSTSGWKTTSTPWRSQMRASRSRSRG